MLRPVVNRYQALMEREKDAVEAPGTGKPAKVEEAPVRSEEAESHAPAKYLSLLISYRSPDPTGGRRLQQYRATYIEHTYNIRYRASRTIRIHGTADGRVKAKMERPVGARYSMKGSLE